MKFDRTSTAACLTSVGCEESTIDPRCSDVSFCMANPDICGTECGSKSPCNDPDYRASHLQECGDDLRCVDPLFAAANPGLCLEAPVLILKPEYAVREVGKSVNYVAYLLANGVETELTSGVIFSTADITIAAISPTSGHATALGEGIVTIGAAYGSLNGFAQLEVIEVDGCAGRTNYFALALDRSYSMSAAFSTLQPSRLAAAKTLAKNFVETIDLDKDHVAALSFDTNVTHEYGFTADSSELTNLKLALKNIAPGMVGSRTNTGAALLDARDFIDLNAGEANKIIVLFSDGENNEGADPVAIAKQLKESGYLIIVVGLRARGTAFLMLDKISSGGFFINDLPSNELSVKDWLVGLKGYICAGNCDPAGGVTVGVGSLNFTDFLQWTVTDGDVDLIGKNTGGPELYDLLPGNGLYVDMCGSVNSGVADDPDLGTMKSSTMTVVVGHLYNVTLSLAGNNREDKESTFLVQAYTGEGVLIDEQTFVLGGFDDFSDHVFQFTATTTAAYLVVSQQSLEAGASNDSGTLFGGVVVSDEADDSVVFTEDFDDDNPTYVDPACFNNGAPYISGYGYECYSSGCLTSPLPVMTPDPSPLAILETS